MGWYESWNTTPNPTTGGTTGTPLTANEQIILGPLQADVAQTIAGSIYSDQSGTLLVQQTFNWDQYTGDANWDISDSITVTGGTGQGFNITIIAPTLQLVYTNGATPQTVMRLFARTFFQGR